MLPLFKQKIFSLPDGTSLTIETGKLAKQADGSAVLKVGDMMLLATVVSKRSAGENVDFLPLSVDYQEKFAAAGKIPGGFLKREGRLSGGSICFKALIAKFPCPTSLLPGPLLGLTSPVENPGKL